MEEDIYSLTLLLSAFANLALAVVLIHNNYLYDGYDVYRRSRSCTALTFFIFAIGFLLHYHFEWRTSWPVAASALSVSYFHTAGVLFSWSHISLLNPYYLTHRVVVRDLTCLGVGLVAYWTATLTHSSISILHATFIIFFLHALYISYIFYRTLHRVRRQVKAMQVNADNASWWTEENKLMVVGFQRSIRISCHFIVLFGLGSIAVTAAFPTQYWPYTVLLILGIMVFCFIFYGLSEYGSVIDAGTNATEDISETQHNTKRNIMAILLTFFPLAGVWAHTETINYIQADGSTSTHGATVLTGSTSPTTLPSGWYVVKGNNVNYSRQLHFSAGPVHLILCDNAKLIINSDATDALQVTGDLTIYGQQCGNGVLETNATYDYSGIHANNNGNITVNGGIINAKSNTGTAITTRGNIIINGGSVQATGEADHGIRATNITLGWRSPADRITAKRYELEPNGNLSVATGKTITDGEGNFYTGIITEKKISNTATKTLMGTHLLYDNGANNDIIASLISSRKPTNITLIGRTLYKDSHWNTICLPFDLTISGSVLNDAKVMKLIPSTSNFTGGTLTLNFENENTTLTAGKPYIIKWDGSSGTIENPTFTNVTLKEANMGT